MRFYKIVLLFLVVLLAGCATSPSNLGNPSGQTQILQGIFGIVTPKNSESGRFTWIQNGDDFSLTLYGPLGLGATNLSTTKTEYALKTPDGQEYLADSPEELMEDVLGWSMPISGFAYWIWGEPDAAAPYEATYNDAKQIVTLNQEGWLISYTWVPKSLVPKSIILTQENITIKIFIN